MIQIQNLHKNYGKNEVLRDINLHIEGGGITAVLGPNGSGKTTLIKCILGMVLPTSGTIALGGHAIQGNWTYRREIAYLPQIANFPGNLRVRELIEMIRDIRQAPGQEDPLVEMFHLQPFLDAKLASLSGGTRQKVNILLSFMFDSPLLILDEPTTGLDPAAMLRLKQYLLEEKGKGKTLLITSHIMHFVEEVASEIIYLLEGRIYFKGTAEALRKITRQSDFEHAIASLSGMDHG